jgi:pimeloyl-ACP methyl ester carboxylesterase
MSLLPIADIELSVFSISATLIEKYSEDNSLAYLTIGKNYRLHYRLIEGVGNKPYLVYLHEGLGCCAMWKDFPESLCRATGCPGLVYDRLGYGKSSPLHEKRTIHYLHHYALRELPILLENIIPGIPYILIGHSDGGSISLISGGERPYDLKGIITEAAHVFVDRETLAGIKTANEAWDKGKLRSLEKYHGDKTDSIFKAWSATWLSPWFKHWNIEYLLPSIETPLLVIQGRNDQYGTIAQARSIAAKSSGYTDLLILKDCAHIPHLEARSVVLASMSSFINKIVEGSCKKLPQ